MVDQYSKEIIETLVADFTPQEVCVYLELCDAPKSEKKEEEIIFFPLDKDGEISKFMVESFKQPQENFIFHFFMTYCN